MSSRLLYSYSIVTSFARVPLFFNETDATEIYTLSLHDALPIFDQNGAPIPNAEVTFANEPSISSRTDADANECGRSEEHTSELQSRQYLVCRLLLEKKNDPGR